MQRLKELRLSKGLTTTQLAAELKCTNQTISHYERGDREPSKDILIKIADYFDVSVDYLLGRTENARDPLSGWTEEEKAAGVGRHPTYLSEDEINWLELRSEILRTQGEDYLAAVVIMLEAVINKKN